jgi:FlaA1/EpsC-like NDP-sugar epimerase
VDAASQPVSSSFDRITAPRIVRYLVLLGYDAAIAAVALGAAFLLRFDGRVPADYADVPLRALAVLLPLRIAFSISFRLYRWSFLMSGLLEAIRLAAAAACGSVLFVAWARFVAHDLTVPRSVVVLDFFLAASLMAAFRFGPRLALGWFHDRRSARSADARRTLVVGAGNSGDLLVRDLARCSDHPYFVVGFVDDDVGKSGTWIDGKPVLGRIEDLRHLIARHRISTVMLAIPSLAGERVRRILKLCSNHKASFKIVRSSFSAGRHRLTAAMLHDLSPEDLLPRDQVDFDRGEVRKLLAGRRVLVTGGAGSIGGEIAQQCADLGASLVVLVDMNENELYLRFRRMREQFPDVDVRAEVADIREASRLHYLGELYQPEYVFHAAAHKHVPLMEDSPEEAIKNNVFGTINVAMMATACGAERLVFISTDKAVKPSSIMGASKRIGELVVRELARGSNTKMTAVRFGNVLGSAGSVVPLFKQQIERGGPVTLTHPDCTRYFMTISEAVGLVLVSGLGGYGDLCVLDMGQAVRISDLATSLITMAGYIPGVEIPIVYQGLRPGEKLHEEPLTEDEERTHVARSGIKVARSPAPPSDLAERLRDLRRAADAGDRDGILRVVRALVPTYKEGAPRAPARPARPSNVVPLVARRAAEARPGMSP